MNEILSVTTLCNSLHLQRRKPRLSKVQWHIWATAKVTVTGQSQDSLSLRTFPAHAPSRPASESQIIHTPQKCRARTQLKCQVHGETRTAWARPALHRQELHSYTSTNTTRNPVHTQGCGLAHLIPCTIPTHKHSPHTPASSDTPPQRARVTDGSRTPMGLCCHNNRQLHIPCPG